MSEIRGRILTTTTHQGGRRTYCQMAERDSSALFYKIVEQADGIANKLTKSL